jgi:hypothetical protein
VGGWGWHTCRALLVRRCGIASCSMMRPTEYMSKRSGLCFDQSIDEIASDITLLFFARSGASVGSTYCSGGQ